MTTETEAGRAIAMKAETRNRRAAAILIVAGAALLAALPFVGVPAFTITLLTEALIFAIWAMSLDLMTGYTGMLSFGHAAGFGLGGYAAGYFAREVTADFFASLLVAELVILAVAVPIGFVAIRLSGAAFAIVSLCIAQVFFQIAVAWRSVTEGMDGLVGVPLPKMLGVTIHVGTEFYLLVVLTAAVVCLGLHQLVRSPFGRTLGAIRVERGSCGLDRHQCRAAQVAGFRHFLGNCRDRRHPDGFHEGRHDADVVVLDRVRGTC